ncbi:MAG: endonuclease domain-containing protein [Proteobacteria bacterium]|nr:endonuclease domain-containing protein [Pseudomonadota bacterium]MBI3497007.1 endonuclease domain-containing protein [Pseudomonadota bacterium]
MARINARTRTRARTLRTTPTEAERVLWRRIRFRQLHGLRFRRQHPVPPYIVDFACLEMGLVVEIDGGQHAMGPRENARTAFLEKVGWRVLRFWNNEVLANIEGVLERITAECPHPCPPPLTRGRG